MKKKIMVISTVKWLNGIVDMTLRIGHKDYTFSLKSQDSAWKVAFYADRGWVGRAINEARLNSIR